MIVYVNHAHRDAHSVTQRPTALYASPVTSLFQMVKWCLHAKWFALLATYQ